MNQEKILDRVLPRVFQAAVAVVFLLGASSCASPSTLRQRPAIRQLVEQHVEAGFSGVVLVAKGEKIIVHDGFGEVAGAAVEQTDRFWIASTGKQFVSAAILRLSDNGKLRLDDALMRFFPDAPPDKAAITIRQLLSHTSGLAQSYVAEQFTTRETAVPAMLSEPLDGAPGEKFRYSNLNYQLAAAVVEIASGENYRAFVANQLWKPTGLESTGFSTPETAGRVSAISTILPPRLTRVTWDDQGVYSSAKDLFRWYRALRNGKVLTDAALAEMFSPATSISEGHAALGWFISRSPKGAERVFTRGNEDFGANSVVYAYPASDTVIIVLTHAGDANAETPWSRLVHRELEALLGL